MKQFKIIFISSLTTILILSVVFAFFYYSSDTIFRKGNDKEFYSNDNYTTDIIPAMNRGDINDSISSRRQTVLTNTVSKVHQAVVGINVTEVRQVRDPRSYDPWFRYFFGDRVYNREIKSLGSGVIISPDGYIVTNDHVAGNAIKVIITMTDGTPYEGKIIGTDQSTDLTLLKIEAEDLPYIRFGNSDDIIIGEWVIALGNPFGLFELNDKPTVTVGVVSATGMNLGASQDRYYVNMIQTDAAINSGNSGGPLVNSLGELIGINTLIYTAGTSAGNVGVGFAIPTNKVKKIIAELKKEGEVDRDFWTGLSIQTITKDIAEYYNLTSSRGVIITDIAKGSPADKAGLEVADIITEIDHYRINNRDTLIGILQEFMSGEKINVKILRNDKTFNKQMLLEKRK